MPAANNWVRSARTRRLLSPRNRPRSAEVDTRRLEHQRILRSRSGMAHILMLAALIADFRMIADLPVELSLFQNSNRSPSTRPGARTACAMTTATRTTPSAWPASSRRPKTARGRQDLGFEPSTASPGGRDHGGPGIRATPREAGRLTRDKDRHRVSTWPAVAVGDVIVPLGRALVSCQVLPTFRHCRPVSHHASRAEGAGWPALGRIAFVNSRPTPRSRPLRPSLPARRRGKQNIVATGIRC